MLSVKIRRVFLALHRVDFRRRYDGLLAEALRLGASADAASAGHGRASTMILDAVCCARVLTCRSGDDLYCA